jgi:hypothetical protein
MRSGSSGRAASAAWDGGVASEITGEAEDRAVGSVREVTVELGGAARDPALPELQAARAIVTVAIEIAKRFISLLSPSPSAPAC